jgi:conjugal transfer pilus assembly protein TraV
MIRATIAPLLAAALVLSGCASSMSGVGGTDSYACKAPEGALCTSVSGVYANSVQGTPQPMKAPAKVVPPAAPAIYGAASIVPGRVAVSAPVGTNIRSNSRVLRVWIAPGEDSDGDLHEEAVIHVLVDTGRWLIEHVRPAVRSRVDGVAPPVPSVQDALPSKAPDEALSPTGRLPLPPGGSPSGIDSIPTER